MTPRAFLEKMLYAMAEMGAADLHLTTGKIPRVRMDAHIIPLNKEIISHVEMEGIVLDILNEQEFRQFHQRKEMDLALHIPGLARFRCNLYWQKGVIGAVFRRIPHEVVPMEKLGLPVDILKYFCSRPKGLVLVTGATGTGKTTTQATMVDYINRTKAVHIITVEDPIEFLHEEKLATITQREVGRDTQSFAQGLKYVLRQDPDVILIGEMRDLETIRAALNIAETGHLVLATLHTSDVIQSVNRIVDVFPAGQQNQVRVQLALELVGVVSQQLVPNRSGKGRVLASEVLVMNHAIRALIREQRLHQIYTALQTSRGEGMYTMNHSLCQLVKAHKIDTEMALSRSSDPDELTKLLV